MKAFIKNKLREGMNHDYTKLPSYEIKSELYWRQILRDNKWALKEFNKIMKYQNGKADVYQMQYLKAAERGAPEGKVPYNSKL